MRQTKPATLYAAPLSKAYWRDAAAELRDTRMLVFAALMIALRVALKSLGIPIAADLKINIAFFVNAFGAMIFGPVVAIIAAAISDTLGCILFPTGAYFFPFIFIEIAGSLIFALFLYRARVTATRVILSRFCIDFFVNILIHFHLHDAREASCHLPLGEGELDWKKYLRLAEAVNGRAVLEVKTAEGLRTSVRRLRAV